MDFDAVIEECRREIVYRAKSTATPYDPEDITCWYGEWGTVVLLTDFDIPWTELQEDGSIVTHAAKTPNVWQEMPRYVVNKAPDRIGNGKTMLGVSLPFVRVRRPDLVILILPDGTIKTGDVINSFQKIVNHQVVRQAQNSLDRIFHTIQMAITQRPDWLIGK